MALQNNMRRFPVAVWALAVRPERVTRSQKGPRAFVLAQREREQRAPCEMKGERKVREERNNFPNFAIQTNLQRPRPLGRFSPGCKRHALPVFVIKKTLTSAERTDVGTGRLETKQRKQADTIIHCLCLRGAESWGVRVCNWMSDVSFSIWMLVVVVSGGVHEEEFRGQSDVI